MTDPSARAGSAWLRTIGSEPEGATPITDEDLDGLIPSFVATRADLNQVEFENIAAALPGCLDLARSSGPIKVLDFVFLFDLHRRMFGDVWKWAGTQRRRETNIGVAPAQIAVQTRTALDDARYWHQNDVFQVDERAVRMHHRLVTVHPFPNGNGRCTRLFADLYLVSVDELPLSWGSHRLDGPADVRRAYIAALEQATGGDYSPLKEFAKG